MLISYLFYYLVADAVFSLGGPAIEEYGDFRQSSNAAKTTGKANGTANRSMILSNREYK